MNNSKVIPIFPAFASRRRLAEQCRRPQIWDDPRRSAVAIPKSNRQGCTRTQTPLPVRHDDPRRDQRSPCCAYCRGYRSSVSLGSQCSAARRPGSDAGLGVPVQKQSGVAQDSQRRRIRWPRGWILFPECDGTDSVWRAWQERTHTAAWTHPGELSEQSEAGAFRKPDEQYDIIEACSPGPFLELFARGDRKKWVGWGNQADDSYEPTWKTYANHSRSGVAAVGD